MKNDFIVLTVVSPQYANEKKLEEFKQWFDKLGYKNITVLADYEGKELTTQLNIRAYPSSAYINSKGELVKLDVGHKNNKELKSIMDNID